MKAARNRADRRRREYERALHCLHVRLLPPLLGVSLALTLVFMAAWLDDDLEVKQNDKRLFSRFPSFFFFSSVDLRLLVRGRVSERGRR